MPDAKGKKLWQQARSPHGMRTKGPCGSQSPSGKWCCVFPSEEGCSKRPRVRSVLERLDSWSTTPSTYPPGQQLCQPSPPGNIPANLPLLVNSDANLAPLGVRFQPLIVAHSQQPLHSCACCSTHVRIPAPSCGRLHLERRLKSIKKLNQGSVIDGTRWLPARVACA